MDAQSVTVYDIFWVAAVRFRGVRRIVMQDVFVEALGLIAAGERPALSTIVSSKGSLPMSKKAKMLVRPDGKIVGTVGGGCLEADVWAEAKQVMESGEPTLQRFILTE